MLLEPKPGDPVALLPHLSAVAAAEALIDATALDIKIRWPNDLYTSGLKLSGILCEGTFRGSEAEAFIVGIGVNVNQSVDALPPDVRARATGLSEHGLDEMDIAAGIVAKLESWWRAREPAAIVARFRDLAEGSSGRAIEVQPRGGETYRAVTQGIADDGGLVVRVTDEKLGDAEERILYSEDVVQLRDGDDRA